MTQTPETDATSLADPLAEADAHTGHEPLTPNDPVLIESLLTRRATWAVVGLSDSPTRTAYRISHWLAGALGMTLVPIHPRAETVHGFAGYASLSDIPTGPVRVVDCFVRSELVGAVVDEAIANAARLQIEAIWLQLGVVDQEAATRARAAGLGVVMDTCPKIEWRRLHP